MILPDDFREFLRCLNARSVEYLVLGGHAVSFHGYPRFTHDQAWADRVEGIIDTVPVHFISKAHLIENKLAVGRPEDQADVARLR